MLGPTTQEIHKILRAAQHGNKAFLQIVFQKYPNYHWTQIYYDGTGDTILHFAAKLGHVEIIKYLLSNFVPISVDCKNKDDKTALHEACQSLEIESCEILIRNGADVNALKRSDWTPLMLACVKDIRPNNSKIVQLLLEHGAIVNFKNKDGWTCLHLVARQGDASILKILLQYGLDAKIKTNNGRSALHIAALHGKQEIVDLLLQVGLDIDDVDSCGNTALHEAILGHHLDVCMLLVKHGANVEKKNNCGENVIHSCTAMGNIEILKFLLTEHKFDLNEPDNSGFTSLRYASTSGEEAIYDLLVSHSACKGINDNCERIPE